jgi:hypothetical protein
MSAFAGTKNPSGDGGYNSTGGASTCPQESSTWSLGKFSGNGLPAMPAQAKQYMLKGAGTGPGLTGAGSQDSGSEDVATASAGSGAPSRTPGSASSTASPTGAAVALGRNAESLGFAPFVIPAAVFMSALFGAVLL